MNLSIIIYIIIYLHVCAPLFTWTIKIRKPISWPYLIFLKEPFLTIAYTNEVNTTVKKIPLGTIESPEQKQQLCEWLEMETPKMGFHQLTFGYFCIDLKAGEEIIATIDLIHNGTIRCNRWKSDAHLYAPAGLLRFLAEQGFPQPLEDEMKRQQKRNAKTQIKEDWIAAAPKCFTKQFDNINRSTDEFVPALKKELHAEIPDAVEQVQRLLTIYGITLTHWETSLAYEEFPNRILRDLDMKEVIDAYLASDKSERITSGFARYLCNMQSKRIRKPYLKFVPDDVIAVFLQKFVGMGDTRGIREIERLGMEKVKSAEKGL